MPLNEPGWWYGRGAMRTWQALALTPLSYVYDWVASQRMIRTDGFEAALPVICVGNFTAGGTGKTPFVCWLADTLKERNHKPAILTRGFGGRLSGPAWVDRDQHGAGDVGDEPLILAKHAPVMVSPDRVKGIQAISQHPDKFDVVIMDDGLQNPSVRKDVSIAVVDGKRGFGNGRVIPAGPLRAALSTQAPRVAAVVVNQGSVTSPSTTQIESITTTLRGQGFAGVVLQATVTVPNDGASLQNERVLAYAGIGNPERFFETVRSLGAEVAHQHTFADHHAITESEAHELLQIAQSKELTLVTTEKDFVRLSSADTRVGALKAASRVVPIEMEFSEQDGAAIKSLIETCCVKSV